MIYVPHNGDQNAVEIMTTALAYFRPGDCNHTAILRAIRHIELHFVHRPVGASEICWFVANRESSIPENGVQP